MEIKRIGLDLAKNVFEVHGVDEAEGVVLRGTLRRGQVLEFFAQWWAWRRAVGPIIGHASSLSWGTLRG